MSLSSHFLEGEVPVLLLPRLPLSAWRALARACKADYAAVRPAYRELTRLALSPTKSVKALLEEDCPVAAALRVWILTGLDAEETCMPLLVNGMYSWAHLGRVPGSGRKPKRHQEHRAQLAAEFPGGPEDQGQTGIQLTMRREMAAVEAAVKIRLSLGGSLNEVAKLSLVPSDLPGKLEGRALVNWSRRRVDTEATALMWATRHGVRWVESMIRWGADATQVTAAGWTALIYAAAFESRGVILDGASDSGASYGGYQSRARGVVGPLLDNGADPAAPTLPLEMFLEAFGPSPVTAPHVSPLDIATEEASLRAGWAEEILERAGRDHVAAQA